MAERSPEVHRCAALFHSTVIPAASGDPEARAIPMKQPCVYILASKRNGTLYVGVTSDVVRRAWQHPPARSRASPSVTASTGWYSLSSMKR